MNAHTPITEARHAERRLRAAARRAHRFNKRPADILRRLKAVRRMNERAVVQGPHADLSALAWFLRDWREAINSACRPARLSDDELSFIAKGHRRFAREERRAVRAGGVA